VLAPTKDARVCWIGSDQKNGERFGGSCWRFDQQLQEKEARQNSARQKLANLCQKNAATTFFLLISPIAVLVLGPSIIYRRTPAVHVQLD
jgi:hypothetical protein